MGSDRLTRKRASLRSAATGFGRGIGSSVSPQGLGAALGGAAALYGATQIGDVAQKIYGAIVKKREFSQMLEADKSLAAAHEENPEQFNRHYNAFRRANPGFAKNPTIAAAYVKQMTELPERAGLIIVNSLKDNPDRRQSRFADALRAQQRSFGGDKADSRLRHHDRVQEYQDSLFPVQGA